MLNCQRVNHEIIPLNSRENPMSIPLNSHICLINDVGLSFSLATKFAQGAASEARKRAINTSSWESELLRPDGQCPKNGGPVAVPQSLNIHGLVSMGTSTGNHGVFTIKHRGFLKIWPLFGG